MVPGLVPLGSRVGEKATVSSKLYVLPIRTAWFLAWFRLVPQLATRTPSSRIVCFSNKNCLVPGLVPLGSTAGHKGAFVKYCVFLQSELLGSGLGPTAGHMDASVKKRTCFK